VTTAYRGSPGNQGGPKTGLKRHCDPQANEARDRGGNGGVPEMVNRGGSSRRGNSREHDTFARRNGPC